MAVRNIILNLMVSIVLVHDVVGVRNVSPEKTPANQLNARDKVAVKTITTKHGDVYDCIDFYQQPAFDHHLLNKHDYPFDPSFVPNDIVDVTKNELDLKRVECPKGTVPIRRTTRQDQITNMPSQVDSQTNDDSSVIYKAGATTHVGIGKIHGASTRLSIYNPSLRASNQYSSSIISVEGGNEFLHVGWTVHPELYGDYNTRFYIWTHVANASCYNVLCPGFIIVNPHHPIDSILKEADDTRIGGEIKVVIYRDKRSGNWWLAIKEQNIRIGFWPKHLFSTLLEGADKAYYGGVVAFSSAPPGIDYPQMGSGKYPSTIYSAGDVAYCRLISTIDQDGNESYAESKSILIEPTTQRYVAYYLRSPGRPKSWESTIIFGGH